MIIRYRLLKFRVLKIENLFVQCVASVAIILQVVTLQALISVTLRFNLEQIISDTHRDR